MAEHISNQIIRSSSSVALNYGEVQAAESKKDFIHKISIVLKELRETQISLKLLAGSIGNENKNKLHDYQTECDQLVAIFHKTVMTAISKKNLALKNLHCLNRANELEIENRPNELEIDN